MGPKMFTTRPCLLKKGAVNRIKPQDAQEVTAGMSQKATRGLRTEVFLAASRSKEMCTGASVRCGLRTSNHKVTLGKLRAMEERSKSLNLEDRKFLSVHRLTEGIPLRKLSTQG